MRFSILNTLVVALAAGTTASSWFPGTKTAYNKWHETELERWLNDHDVPYPAAADRKNLEDLVTKNWDEKVVKPLSAAGDKTGDHYGSVKDWIFDSWTESSLKSFLDHNNIPNPQPRTRDSLLKSARQNYDAIAKKSGQHSYYPGDWLYQTWAESDLKEYLDARGIPVPQPSTRDKLVATIRRNARLASLNSQSAASSASASASGAQASLTDMLFDAWSDSQLKEFLDTHGVPVPQGSRKNELVALARKQRASLFGNSASSASASGSSALSGGSSVASASGSSALSGASASGASAYGGASASGASALSGASASGASALSGASASGASAYGAATSQAGNQFAKATDNAQLAAEDAFNSAVDTWSDSRLKAYLDSRGVPVPQSGTSDELKAKVRLNRHKASTGWSAWTFDTWTVENLEKYLGANTKKYKKNAKATRDDLVKQAQDAYASASKSGGTNYASVTDYLAKQTDAAKDTTFDTWSDSDIKDYLDSYGVPNYQGSTTNELRAAAKKQYNYFKYGTSSPSGTVFAKLQEGFNWLLAQAGIGASSASSYASGQATLAASQAAHSTASVKNEL